MDDMYYEALNEKIDALNLKIKATWDKVNTSRDILIEEIVRRTSCPPDCYKKGEALKPKGITPTGSSVAEPRIEWKTERRLPLISTESLYVTKSEAEIKLKELESQMTDKIREAAAEAAREAYEECLEIVMNSAGINVRQEIKNAVASVSFPIKRAMRDKLGSASPGASDTYNSKTRGDD
jgi:hypothetical protein